MPKRNKKKTQPSSQLRPGTAQNKIKNIDKMLQTATGAYIDHLQARRKYWEGKL